MFTGIIEQVGKIKKIDGNEFTIEHAFDEELKIGESVAINGACMTVLEQAVSTFVIEMMEESRNRTVFSESKEGDKVNLERSARIGDRNSGHNVTGHIDQVGEILKLKKMSDYWIFKIGIKKENEKLIVEKGSVSVEGISLTISDSNPGSKNPEPRLESSWFEVSILPYTMEETNLHAKNVGDHVNIEFDILGKYLLKNSQPPSS